MIILIDNWLLLIDGTDSERTLSHTGYGER